MPQMFSDETPEQARERTWEELGDISGVPVYFNQVLLAIYQRPKMTKSGIMLSDKTLNEDTRQGKAMMVVKMGPGVDMDDANVKFFGRKLSIGQWIAIQPSEGWPVNLNGKQCRMIADYRILMGVDRPDRVW